MEADKPVKPAAKRPLIMSAMDTGNDWEFNACVGINTGSSDNSIGYAGGFEKAAEVLLASIGVPRPDISPQAWGSDPLVDMLVYPICFCARHHVELSIKRMLPKAWQAYIIKFPSNHNKLTEPKAADIRHDIKAVWTDLVTISTAVDPRFEQLRDDLEPYIEDLSQIDATGQVFRYHTDARDSSLNLKDTYHIDLAHFAGGYAQMCQILAQFESLILSVTGWLETGSFTSKLTREQLLEIAQALPDRSTWGESEFVAAKQQIMERYGLSGTDFKKATDIILGSRWLSFRVGVEIPIAHLKSGVFKRLRKVDPKHRQRMETLTEDERSALLGLYESGSFFSYPEDFDSYIVPRPVKVRAAQRFDNARDEDYLARKYASNPDRVETALKELGQFELLAEFQQVYQRELERLRVAAKASGLDKIIWTGSQHPVPDPAPDK